MSSRKLEEACKTPECRRWLGTTHVESMSFTVMREMRLTNEMHAWSRMTLPTLPTCIWAIREYDELRAGWRDVR